MAEAKLKENPYDLEAWNVLIKEYQSKNIDEARAFYEKLVEKFPLTGRYWKIYIEHEMKTKNYEKVEKEAKGSQPKFDEKMAQAYDFAIEKIGIDIHSYQIWNDYVIFLKNVDAVGSYAENQKITAVRRVYQRGVVNPMINIETFWKDYISYEQGINQIIADKMIADRSRDYMNARRVAKEYEAVTKGLNRNAPSLPPSSRAEDLKQVALWKKYIQWEKGNPLRTEDETLITKRVIFAYEQCLLCLGHYPDIWYEFCAYLEENARISSEKGDINQCKSLQEEVNGVYDRATTSLLQNSSLIHFAFADFEESRNRKEKAGEIYNKLLDTKQIDPTLVYIQYMKFARRSEGIKSARNVFKRAREDSRSGAQVYTCAALMEYYCSKDTQVACKIFELGLKKYSSDVEFILSYIDFLSHLNEENNTRVLFERVLTSGTLPAEQSIQIWNKFLEFESTIGDLSSIVKVEKRRAQALEKICKDVSPTAWLIDRYKFNDIMPCTPQELKSIGYAPKTSPALSGINGNVLQSNQLVNGNDYTITSLKPDVKQMLPFKPKINPVPGSHTLPGGIFPPPPAVGALLAQLPHPSCFHGPFVAVDDLMKLFVASAQIPSSRDTSSIKPEGIQGSVGMKLFETALKASSTMNNNSNSNDGHEKFGFKRGVPLEDEDDVEGDNSNQLPTYDIYRSRQMQKRIK